MSTNRIAANTRAILRDILRQASYLPDELAQKHARESALLRFRHYQNTKDEQRIKRVLARARLFANQLRRANDGEKTSLLSILMSTYGRDGRRRRELLQPLLGSGTIKQKRAWLNDIPGFVHDWTQEQRDHALRSLEVSNENPADELPVLPRVSPALRSLVNAQLRVGPPKRRGGKLRKLRPDIPKLNTWLRPMPQVRVRNLARQGYADMLVRVCSPLPPLEWEHLRRLASAETTPRVPQFRTPAPSPSLSVANDALDMIATKPKPDVRKALGNREARRITPRTLQRFYRQVFELCPTMLWDADRQDWRIIWGS